MFAGISGMNALLIVLLISRIADLTAAPPGGRAAGVGAEALIPIMDAVVSIGLLALGLLVGNAVFVWVWRRLAGLFRRPCPSCLASILDSSLVCCRCGTAPRRTSGWQASLHRAFFGSPLPAGPGVGRHPARPGRQPIRARRTDPAAPASASRDLPVRPANRW